MSKYVRQQIETLSDVDQNVFMQMMQDDRFEKGFTVDFDDKRLADNYYGVTVPKDQRDVDCTVRIDGKTQVGLVFKEDGKLEIRGDFWGTNMSLKTLSEQLGMLYQAYNFAYQLDAMNFMGQIEQTQDYIELTYTR
jgi:hypothetical protein|uniref:DUF1257 domain-containing protein n=1 Tax=Myoviridae sp. ctJ2i1 TaxID=2825079 RepID=A0A8S5V1U7_9CAUD|nr:MAG TPA: hypothetical protein [Myoviridae sp. ctJ2i1]DAV32898.1 MAG TPA: hypothetical protein [Caudoviricetes sp.]DAW79456.1 MAG TPA: hypothetical protein [Caudoviricetes sp.]